MKRRRREVVKTCLACGRPLDMVARAYGGRFCSSRCWGYWRVYCHRVRQGRVSEERFRQLLLARHMKALWEDIQHWGRDVLTPQGMAELGRLIKAVIERARRGEPTEKAEERLRRIINAILKAL